MAPEKRTTQLLHSRQQRPILDLPPDLLAMRQKLFDVKDVITLSSAEYALYWPWIDNVWSHHGTGPMTKKGTMLRKLNCRLRRKTYTPQAASDTPKKRNKGHREGRTCNCFLKMTIRQTEPRYTLRMIGSHSHDLDHMDQVKINSGVRSAAQGLLLQGLSPTLVLRVLHELASGDRKPLLEAGGRYMNCQDVANQALVRRKADIDLPSDPVEAQCSDPQERLKRAMLDFGATVS